MYDKHKVNPGTPTYKYTFTVKQLNTKYMDVFMDKYTEEERKRWIEELKNSGSSIKSPDKKNYLSVSIVTVQMNRCNKKLKTSKDIEFIEINTPPPSHMLKMEIGDVNISVDGSTDLELLARLIKAVNTVNI